MNKLSKSGLIVPEHEGVRGYRPADVDRWKRHLDWREKQSRLAVAFDHAADLGNNGGSTNSRSGNYTCTGSNLVLFITIIGDTSPAGNDDITTVTYNGVGASLLKKNTPNSLGSGRFAYIYGLLAPATGSNSIAVNCTNNHYLLVGAASYSGVLQSGLPDNSAVSDASSAVTTLTTTLTPTAANCWTFLLEFGYNSNNPPSAGTGSTRRTFDGTLGTWGIFDSNGPVTGGSPYSMTTTRSGAPSSWITQTMISFAPAAAAGVNPCNLMTMGVGKCAAPLAGLEWLRHRKNRIRGGR